MLTVVRSDVETIRAERANGPCTGEMWREILLQESGTSFSKNFFTPCARTHWHSHEGGQLLIVESGEGFVATADQVVRMGVGDMVWTPPKVRHWHGASHSRSMLHLAFSLGGVDWQEAVQDEMYESVRAAG
ncbi:cupin domain-containing protein [Sinomonas terrae]|uniref:Cupin domain-containing protein n=1 Tax=Sinomonas terrae TaxID=2908838 RepID=A0ABS9U208_9MICC|nr:cupin domain-containing protein [Sinomonas terrae]MCH6470719.1 cupin domain-containing protein [Sinomonas terrae]